MPNEIHLFGVIGRTRDGSGVTAQAVKTQLAAMDQSEPLIVRIDSEGGSVFDGLSIYEAFRAYPGPKKAVVESTAFSIASYIACAFDDVEIAENGYFMIHEPSTEAEGTQQDLSRSVELLKKLDTSMVEAYSRKTGLGEDEVRNVMRAESFFNASESMAMGLASSVSPGVVATRIAPMAKHTRLPQRVFTALFGAGSNDGEPDDKEKTPVAETPKPKAASIKEIKAAYPKMSSDFVLKCVEGEMPMASVASAAAEELTSENEELLAKLAAQDEELVALRAKVGAMDEEMPEAEGDEEPAAMEDEEEEPAAKAKAKRSGAAPVARRTTSPTKDFTAEWNSAVDGFVAKGMKRPQAVMAANKANPGLREMVVKAANARR